MTKRFILLLSILINVAQAQENDFLFGIQIKPIIPNSYFNANGLSQDFYSSDSTLYAYDLKPKLGQSIGMNIRKNITNVISFETGLNLIQRRYKLELVNQNINDHTNFTIRSYEVPIQLLSYVRVSDQWYLNGSFGISYNVFASDIYSEGEKNSFFYQNTVRRKKGQSAFIVNLGTEYRTKTKGYFYFGFSFHRPFKSIVRVFPEFNDGINKFNVSAPSLNSDFLELNGNYFTIDIRYFFKLEK
tara:strand:- start:2868 stop:3599 length:732 start_codon:yes stop_codon:yes gene_type:complete